MRNVVQLQHCLDIQLKYKGRKYIYNIFRLRIDFGTRRTKNEFDFNNNYIVPIMMFDKNYLAN